jgi:hypothetical protein
MSVASLIERDSRQLWIGAITGLLLSRWLDVDRRPGMSCWSVQSRRWRRVQQLQRRLRVSCCVDVV